VTQNPADQGPGGPDDGDLSPDQPTGIQDDADYVGPYGEVVKGSELRRRLFDITSPEYPNSSRYKGPARDWGGL
jgi:hypothetical protein